MKTIPIILVLLGIPLTHSYSDDHPLATYHVIRAVEDVRETILLSKDDPRPERSEELRSTRPRKTIIREGDKVDGLLVASVDKTSRTIRLEKNGKEVTVTSIPEGPQTNYWVIVQPSMQRLNIGDKLQNNWILSRVKPDGSAVFTNQEAETFTISYEDTKGSNHGLLRTGDPRTARQSAEP